MTSCSVPTDFRAAVLNVDELVDRMDYIVRDVTSPGVMEELETLAGIFKDLGPTHHEGSLVSENHLNDYIKEEMTNDSPFGVDFDELPYSCIDWDDVAVKRTDDMDEVIINYVTYYYFD
jgi:hypothetical protein